MAVTLTAIISQHLPDSRGILEFQDPRLFLYRPYALPQGSTLWQLIATVNFLLLAFFRLRGSGIITMIMFVEEGQMMRGRAIHPDEYRDDPQETVRHVEQPGERTERNVIYIHPSEPAPSITPARQDAVMLNFGAAAPQAA